MTSGYEAHYMFVYLKYKFLVPPSSTFPVSNMNKEQIKQISKQVNTRIIKSIECIYQTEPNRNA